MKLFKLLSLVSIFIMLSMYLLTGCSTSGGEVIDSPLADGKIAKFQKTKPYIKEIYAMSQPGKGFDKIYGTGAKGSFMWCDEKQFQVLQQIISRGQCPASFMNKNKKLILILSNNPKLTTPLNNIKQNDKISINGSEAKFLGLFDATGNKIPLKLYGDLNSLTPVYVDNITINGTYYF